MRLLPGDDKDSIMQYLQDTIKDDSIAISLDVYNPPTPESSLDSWIYRQIGESVKTIYPQALIAPSLLVAGTDSKHFVDVADNVYRFIPSLMGMDAVQSIHGNNERIGISSLFNMVQISIEMLRKAASHDHD